MATATGPAGAGGETRRVFSASKTFAAATGGIAISPPCRAIRAGGAGTVVLTYATGDQDTITAAAGELLEVQAVNIDATSGATLITVFW